MVLLKEKFGCIPIKEINMSSDLVAENQNVCRENKKKGKLPGVRFR